MARKKSDPRSVETIVHDLDKRKNIPTAEFLPVVRDEDRRPLRVAFQRRNPDLDPQLVWRGKEDQDRAELVANAPPLYIQEKVHPKALVDDLKRHSHKDAEFHQHNLFADFNGIPEGVDKTEFYKHDQNWTNRMILGDSLQVMASLAEREGLRGKVQCVYIDPPYGIKFNSNFQWSTTSRDVKDGKPDHITREPEQVKAFRDTWRDGVHSYLSYLRDRLTVAHDLLTESGSVFVQIGDENVHRVRAVMDEVFGDRNSCGFITFKKTSGAGSFAGGTNLIAAVYDYIVWYAKDIDRVKYRQMYNIKDLAGLGGGQYSRVLEPDGLERSISQDEVRGADVNGKVFRGDNLTSQTTRVGQTTIFPVQVHGSTFTPTKGGWKTNRLGMSRLQMADRLYPQGNTLSYRRFFEDFALFPVVNSWDDTVTSGFGETKTYVVQTNTRVVERCLLMATDPGDLVLDPTCGSGTTAYVAEQWGRRWITIDTSRVALALARARIMGARYPFYLLADSPEGQRKEAEVTRTEPSPHPTRGDVRHGFVYERVPHVTLKSIANNAEIDEIWERWQAKLEPLRESLNAALKKSWREWEIPREPAAGWPDAAVKTLGAWWKARIARQKEIDASIAARAEFEYLYDKPYEDRKKVRVAGPFTVESLSPHRTLGVDENDELIDPMERVDDDRGGFVAMVLEHLKTAGVQQAHKEDRIEFESLALWPGKYVCAEGRYREGDAEKRAAVFIGEEFGTVQRPDISAAAREAAEGGFHALIACAFNYDAASTDLSNLGRMPILKARMNADLHMAGELKNTGKGNLFVVFGEPDATVETEPDGRLRVRIRGVDVFKPQTGEVVSDGADGIACWFVDTDYNEEGFFVRHAYFLGANDPYKALRTTLKGEIDAESWETLHSDVSRPFERPESGRIAVKVINHLGDEVMKVFRV